MQTIAKISIKCIGKTDKKKADTESTKIFVVCIYEEKELKGIVPVRKFFLQRFTKFQSPLSLFRWRLIDHQIDRATLRIALLQVVGIVSLVFTTLSLYAQPKDACLDWTQGIEKGALLVYNMTDQTTVCSFRAEQAFIPASIAKIPLSLVALNSLGPNFRFTTHFLVDDKDALIMQGTGDPFLTSEEIALMAGRLRALGFLRFQRLVFDTHLYAESLEVPGSSKSLNPYDVAISPINVNFNTIYIEKDAKGQISSAESQTPTLPIMLEKGKTFLKPGTKDRINIGSPKEILLYAHQLIRAIFAQHGIEFFDPNFYEINALPPSRTLLSYSNSRNLTAILANMLQYSNNMQANNILLQIGVKSYGYPANLDQGLKAFHRILEQNFHFQPKELIFYEGSGLSPASRVNAKAMLKALEAFFPYKDLLPFKKNSWLKSGTLTGVYNYAGYLKIKNKDYAFVLILNQNRNLRDAILKKIEDNLSTDYYP